jgi:hypothetical protein
MLRTRIPPQYFTLSSSFRIKIKSREKAFEDHLKSFKKGLQNDINNLSIKLIKLFFS